MNSKNITAQNFAAEVIEASKTIPVMVDFWAEWCGPCKQLMPLLDRLADEYTGRFVLAKVNADEQQELTASIGIRSLPTVVLFKGGQVADHFVGAQTETHIRQMLDKHLPAAQKSPLQQARELALANQHAEAIAVLEKALAVDPNNIDLQCGLGEIKAAQGDLAAARSCLDAAKAREPKSQAVKRLTALIEFSDVLQTYPDPERVRHALGANPGDLDARHALAVHRLLAADYDAALEDWLGLMRTNRKYKDDLARKSLVMAFDLIGNEDPRVAQTRREMARLLF